MSPLSNLRRARLGAVAAAVGALCASPATAADRWWSYAAGCDSADFTSTSCWLATPGDFTAVVPPPVAGDTLILTLNRATDLTSSVANSASPLLPVYGRLEVWGRSSGVAGLNIARNTLQVSGVTDVGQIPSFGSYRGRINQSGGTAQFADLNVRTGSEYNMSGGNMSWSRLSLAAGSTLSQTGGTVTASGDRQLSIGGNYFLDGGTLDIRGATPFQASTGRLELGGGTLLTNPGQTLQMGTLNFLGGDRNALMRTKIDADVFNIRNDYGFNGEVVLSSDTRANTLNIGSLPGSSGFGRFAVVSFEGGVHTVAGTMSVLTGGDQQVIASVGFNARMTAQQLAIGGSGTGATRLEVQNAQLAVQGAATIGESDVSRSASLAVSGTNAQAHVGGLLTVFGQATAGFAGRLTIEGTTTIGHAGSPQIEARLTAFDDGQVVANGDVNVLAGSRVGLTNSSTLNVKGTFDNAAGANVQVLSGSTATFEGAYQGTGGMEIGAGSTVNFLGQVSRQGGVGFSGTGTANYAGVVALDLIRPINDAGNFNLQSTASTQVTLGISPFTGGLSVAGHLGFGGAFIFNTGGTLYGIGSRLDFFDWGTTSGQFSAIDLSQAGLFGDNVYWDTSELYTAGVLKVSAVPEPGAVAMWLAGLAVMGSLVRRRQRG